MNILTLVRKLKAEGVSPDLAAAIANQQLGGTLEAVRPPLAKPLTAETATRPHTPLLERLQTQVHGAPTPVPAPDAISVWGGLHALPRTAAEALTDRMGGETRVVLEVMSDLKTHTVEEIARTIIARLPGLSLQGCETLALKACRNLASNHHRLQITCERASKGAAPSTWKLTLHNPPSV